jgi:hypothetical protein
MWAALEEALAEGRRRQAAGLAAGLVARPQRLWAVVARRVQVALWTRRGRHLAAHDQRVVAALRAFAGTGGDGL